MNVRLAGKLHIGSVMYTGGVFTVDMEFVTPHHIDDDVERSAALAVQQHFYRLLISNGFFNHGSPEMRIVRSTPRSVFFVIGCQAQRNKPKPIVIESMRDKDDGSNSGKPN